MIDKIIAVLFLAFCVYVLWRVLVLVTYNPPAYRSYSCPNEHIVGDDYEFEPANTNELPTQERYKEIAWAEVEFRMKAEKMLKDVST